MTERTLCIVKPDAMRARALGRILAMIEDKGLAPIAGRIVRLAPGDAPESRMASTAITPSRTTTTAKPAASMRRPRSMTSR